MEITLIENALDFILSAVEHAEQVNDRSLKYAVLHLSDGVELILKEKLKREHWSLLFADANKANENALKTGEFKSVDFDECVGRLESISGLNMKSHIELLRSLRRHRNKLQHFEYNGSRDEVISILVKTWGVVLDFVHDHLPDVIEDQSAIIDKIKGFMANNESFVEARLDSIKTAVDEFMLSSTAVLDCPKCLQELLFIPGAEEDPYCLFCRYSTSPEEAVDDWCAEFLGIQSPKERYTEPDRFSCPECGRETLIQQEFGGMRPPVPGWVCFNCGQTWDYDDIAFCDSCHEPYSSIEDDLGMCSDCEDMWLKRE